MLALDVAHKRFDLQTISELDTGHNNEPFINAFLLSNITRIGSGIAVSLAVCRNTARYLWPVL